MGALPPQTIRMSSVTWARTSSMCAPYCSMLYRHTNLDINQVHGTPQRRAETQVKDNLPHVTVSGRRPPSALMHYHDEIRIFSRLMTNAIIRNYKGRTRRQ